MITTKLQFIKWTFWIFLKLFVAGHPCHNCIFFSVFPRFPRVSSSPQNSSLLAHSCSLSTHTTHFCSDLCPIFFTTTINTRSAATISTSGTSSTTGVLFLLPHLPTSRFNNTSRKPRLLSPLVDHHDGSKKIGMNGKIITFHMWSECKTLSATDLYASCGKWYTIATVDVSAPFHSVYNSYYVPFLHSLVFPHLIPLICPSPNLMVSLNWSLPLFSNYLHFKLSSFLQGARKRRRKI